MPRQELVRGGISICGGLAIWEILARLLLENELLIPPPSSVARSFWNLTVSGQLNQHLAATLIEFIYGYSTACVIGVVIGYLTERIIAMGIVRKVVSALTGVSLFVIANSDALYAADAGLLKMRFTQSGNTSSSWPLYVAEQKKIFEKNGIQVESIIIRGATNIVRAVLSETVPIGRINPDYVIGAVEKGGKVKIVAANMEKIPYDIYARPEIKTGADLKGKTLGVSTLTGGTTLMVHEVLEKAYRLKENDYKLLVVGTSPERYAALKGGSVQASFMGPPFTFRAAKDGFRKLANFHEHLGQVLFTTDFAHANYIKSNRAEIVRYLKSMIEATRWLYDPKHKEEALAIHMKVLKSPRESAEEDYKYLVQDFQPFPRDGLVGKVSFDKTMDLRAKEGTYQGKKTPPASDYVDNSLVEEALKSLGK